VSPAARYEVLWTETAFQMLSGIGDRRIQQQLFDTSKRLEVEPDKQGKPLHESLLGYRSLRAAGQRYRVIYSLDPKTLRVYVVAAGLRRQRARDDIYELAQRMIGLGLAPSVRRPQERVRKVARPKKKR
jgi:mRNA interferase RelE/StbE